MKRVIKTGKYLRHTSEEPVNSSPGRWYFGKEQADYFGDLIEEKLAGQTVSKRRDLANEPGGLIYEADRLEMDMWELLEALEGMCMQGRARELDDSTYKVIESPAQKERYEKMMRDSSY